MFDELIKSLRLCTSDKRGYGCAKECAYGKKHPLNWWCMDYLLREAADAVEELSKQLDAKPVDGDKFVDAIIKSYEQSRWIPVTERLPSDFVSVQAHMTDAGNFPPVREAYVVDKLWFFPALKEFHPVDMWRQFDEPPKEE